MTMHSGDRDVVVLTGATGFLGRELLWKLMQELPPDCDVVCIIREGGKHKAGRSTPEALQAAADGRLTELLAEGCPLAAEDPRRQRVRALCGDITQPRLGLSDEQYGALAAACTYVFHGAATVRFDLELFEAQRINVDGTRTVVEFAEEAQRRGRLRRFCYIGTAYVAGRRVGRVGEDELECGQEFNNTYEQTKCAAEALVRQHMHARGDRPALPTTLFRPSIIVGDSKSGYTSSFKVMYWPLKIFARGLIPIVPASRAGLVDLVPVDYVVDAIWALSQLPGSVGQCYHLAAGPEHEITIGAAMEAAARFFGVYKPLFMPTGIYLRYIRPALKLLFRGKRRRALDAGRVYVPYLNYRASFDTSNARRDLAASGLAIPDVAQYFDTLLRFCVETDWGKRPVPPRR
jgi:thioester reductase-like protein